MATRKPGFKANLKKWRLKPSIQGLVPPPRLPVPVQVVQFTGRRRPAKLLTRAFFVKPEAARGSGSRKAVIEVKLVVRPKRYAPKGKIKQIGTWGTGTRKPPIRAIRVVAVRRPRRYILDKGLAKFLKPIRIPAVVITRHVKAIQAILTKRAQRYRPAGSVSFLRPVRTFQPSRTIKAIRVVLAKQPKRYRPIGSVHVLKPVRTFQPSRKIPLHITLVPRSTRYRFQGKQKWIGPFGVYPVAAAQHVEAIRTILTKRAQRYRPEGDVKFIKPVGKRITVKPPIRAIKVVGIRRPSRLIFKGKTKQIGGFGSSTVVQPVKLRKILTVLVKPSRRYWKKVRKQVLSDHLAALTRRVQPRFGPTLLQVRPRRYTVNRGKVIQIKRFGALTKKPPIYHIKVVSLIQRRRRLPETAMVLGNVVRTFGVTAPPEAGVYIPTYRRHRR